MDIEATMQFIVEHQARLSASLEKHDEEMAELRKLGTGHEERIAKLETSVATVTDLVGRLGQAEIRLVERMEKLKNSNSGSLSAWTALSKALRATATRHLSYPPALRL